MNSGELNSGWRVTLVGPGAVGWVLAQRLLGLGFQVRCRARSGLGPVAAQVIAYGQSQTLTLAAADSDWIRTSHLVIVAVKAFDLKSALATSLREVSPGTVVLSVSNGDVEGILEEAYSPPSNFYLRRGVATFGVSSPSHGVFELRSRAGELSFGPMPRDEQDPQRRQPQAVEKAILTGEARLDPRLFVWHQSMALLARRKWIYNLTINTLSAALKLPNNGALMSDLPMLYGVLGESMELAQERFGSLPVGRDELKTGLERLIEATAANENSMARDLREGRPTEADYLSGLATPAARYPLLFGLHQKIKAMESGA